jgi:ATP-binding cassette subfamily B multidrug efflux pump
MRVILRILGMVFKKYKKRVIIGYISVIGAAAASLFIPRVIGTSVNQVVESGEKDVTSLFMLALILLLAGTARGLFSFAQTYLGESTGQLVAYDIRNEFYDKLQHLSFGFHDKQSTGGLMSRATADVEGIRMFVNMGAIRFGFIVAMIIGVTISMLLTDFKLAVITLTFVPVMAWLGITTSRSLRKMWLRVQELTAEMVTVLQENLTGIRLVKAFAAEDYEKEKFGASAKDVSEAMITAQQRWAKNFAAMNFSFILALGVILWVGGVEVINGKTVVNGQLMYSGLTPGDLTAFIFYMGLLTMPVRMMGWLVNNVSRAASCGQRIFEVLDVESPVKEIPGAENLVNISGNIVFKNVSFSYTPERPALTNASVDVQQGQTIALVGRPGSGKSTFCHLIPRFYDVTEGQITIDGIDVREVTLSSLRSVVGIVQQDIFIHTMSIRNNIAYGQQNASQEDIERVAKISQLHDFIISLPDGYDSMVGERGVGLSGGQRQRLSIARTLLTKPSVLILDDSTSSVDAQTEHLLQMTITEALENRTTFIITNRLSTIKSADLILVFKNGKIIERGNETELLELNGEYKELYEYQIRPHEESLNQMKSNSLHEVGF